MQPGVVVDIDRLDERDAALLAQRPTLLAWTRRTCTGVVYLNDRVVYRYSGFVCVVWGLIYGLLRFIGDDICANFGSRYYFIFFFKESLLLREWFSGLSIESG